MQELFEKTSKYTLPLNINNLHGRLLQIPPQDSKKRNILLIYGHHSSLERMYGIAEELSKYGKVIVPDLPGFGGMDSFYKIGMKPTIDNFADYLATFIKFKCRRSQLTVVGMSFGFVVVTRMLQRYPELSKRVELLVSVVGFSHSDDFVFTKRRKLFYITGSRIASTRLVAVAFKNLALHPFVIKTMYAKTHNAKNKFEHLTEKEKKTAIDFEIYLWHCNEVRTYMSTAAQFLRVNNCTKQVDLPVWHIAVKDDNYFNNEIVEQHMRVIFKDFQLDTAILPSHAPSVIANAEEAAPLFPKKIREELSK